MASNNDQAMVTMTGFSNEAFQYLLALFTPVNDEYSPFVDEDGYIVEKIERVGRPRTIQPENCLGLLVVWSHTHGSMMVLQLIFVTAMTHLSKYLQFIGRIVIRHLKNYPLAKLSSLATKSYKSTKKISLVGIQLYRMSEGHHRRT
jgi:hypothetical protein